VIYEPWQKPMLWVFDRGEELEYNAQVAMREIEKIPFLFPEIAEEDKERYEFKTSLISCANDGYKPGNAQVIRGWWQNLLLAGRRLTRESNSANEATLVIMMNNHPAVVDMARFKRAYKYCSAKHSNTTATLKQ
jgi:hypothetical protein